MSNATLAGLATVLLAAHAIANGAPTKQLEIKGLHLGMPESAARQIDNLPSTTVAGVRSANAEGPALSLKFGDGRLESVLFVFKSDDFGKVRDALKAKYPGLQCTKYRLAYKESSWRTRSVDHEECSLVLGEAALMLHQHGSQVFRSELALVSKRAYGERAAARKKALDEAESKKRDRARPKTDDL
ncbi:hypothetical protein [Roseateles asaccharophilus]|uniref:Uncharacterized protein n=1 Tax=Roseateles asaccharophilus TaxID=582607 RepID=A0ABU2A3K2_9BURK|nr:hypothetical protein [Roseateles asaccharophilus]MDR7331741.1 hypothetical protein [Roseateles asaccharophilus]